MTPHFLSLQLKAAAILTLGYALFMLAALISMLTDITDQGWCSPGTILTSAIAAAFICGALLHPQEFWNLPHAILFALLIPSVFVYLMIYVVVNLNDMAWGTREQTTTASRVKQQKGYSCGVKGMFKWILFPKTSIADEHTIGMTIKIYKECVDGFVLTFTLKKDTNINFNSHWKQIELKSCNAFGIQN